MSPGLGSVVQGGEEGRVRGPVEALLYDLAVAIHHVVIAINSVRTVFS